MSLRKIARYCMRLRDIMRDYAHLYDTTVGDYVGLGGEIARDCGRSHEKKGARQHKSGRDIFTSYSLTAQHVQAHCV